MQQFKRLSLAGLMVAAIAALPVGSAAAPAPCEIGQPGCKTVDSPKNNPKFSETQRGNVDAAGTESTCFDANRGQTKQTC
jgi:hypothetical protein